MRSRVLCRRAFCSALRSGNHGLAPGSRKSLQVTVKPFCGEGLGSQWQYLQQARRWGLHTSALMEIGSVAADYPFCIQQSRFASSSKDHVFPLLDRDLATHADEGLLHVLRCEVEDSTKRSVNITPRRPPKPFTLAKDEPGEMEMTLTRIYGLEDIELSCVLQLVRREYQRKPEVGEDPESRTKMLQLTISIRKGGPFPILKIRCEGYRDGFCIHQVDLEGADEEQTVYRPYFSDSKEELVNSFQVFLYERGLNGDLSGYMLKHLERKRLLKSAAVIEKITEFLGADSSSPED